LNAKARELPNNAMQPTAASELAVTLVARSSAAADGKRYAVQLVAMANPDLKECLLATRNVPNSRFSNDPPPSH
jgi:cell division septation protein DedD